MACRTLSARLCAGLAGWPGLYVSASSLEKSSRGSFSSSLSEEGGGEGRESLSYIFTSTSCVAGRGAESNPRSPRISLVAERASWTVLEYPGPAGDRGNYI